ncbi:MAG: hypothetical protein WDN24_02940 [Sphingomonas sp.]
MAAPAELRAAHDELLRLLTELDVMTQLDRPEESALANARWRLSRARARRRALVETATARLLEAAAPAEAERLRAYRDRNAEHFRRTSSHVGAWGLREAVADWPGYVRASAPMRREMRELIAEDRRVLYPLLGGAG